MSRTKRTVPFWAWTAAQKRGQDGTHGWREPLSLTVDRRTGETRNSWYGDNGHTSRMQRIANKVKIREGLADWLEPITEEDWEGYDPDEHDWWYGGDDYDYEYPQPDDYYDDPSWYFDDYDYRWDVV